MENLTKNYAILSEEKLSNKDDKIILLNENNFWDNEKNLHLENEEPEIQREEIFVPDWKLHDYTIV